MLRGQDLWLATGLPAASWQVPDSEDEETDCPPCIPFCRETSKFLSRKEKLLLVSRLPHSIRVLNFMHVANSGGKIPIWEDLCDRQGPKLRSQQTRDLRFLMKDGGMSLLQTCKRIMWG